jgi:GT2 family glycosyltransferase
MTATAVHQTIYGVVDGFEGSYLVGWALSSLATRNCMIEVVDESGRIVAANRASKVRSDLAKLGFGRTNFAFRILIDGAASNSNLRIFADGFELPGSPIYVGPGEYDGRIAIENGFVSGWVTERQPSSDLPLIRVVDQSGRVVHEELAAYDVETVDKHFRPARFGFSVPNDCYGAPELALRASIDGREFAAAHCALRTNGYLDGVWPDRCVGWLMSPDLPSKRFEVEVLRDGRVIGRGTCNVPRSDLREHFPSAWEVGFDIPLLETDNKVTETSTLSIRLAGTERELFDGPFIVGRRAAFISGTRRVARLVHSADIELDLAQRAALQAALVQYNSGLRSGSDYIWLPFKDDAANEEGFAPVSQPRLNIIIPIYKGVEVTRACIESVLTHRDPERDVVVLVNDRSPEADMEPMLFEYVGAKNLHLLNNPENLGFVKSVNRALNFCLAGDVVLLNSDTRVFAGGLDELYNVAHSSNDVGTVTAMSNNATIFSYPHSLLASSELADISWDELAAAALQQNAGRAFEVPTGHGFCMLVKRKVLNRVPSLDEQFGRGYGEENAFCLKAEDLGFRHVAAAGVLVEHRESVSFGDAIRIEQLKANLPVLERMYPEYTGTIIEFQKRDDLRRARWGLDGVRLRRFSNANGGQQAFALVIANSLGGGTKKALDDLETAVGYGTKAVLRLSADSSGMTLECKNLMLRAFFLHNETDALLELLDAAQVDLVVVHQLLGFSASTINILKDYIRTRRSIVYLHDFYAICPRVTMIDAVGQFCRVGSDDRCSRCVKLGGVHEASQTGELHPAEHRALMSEFLAAADKVIAPSLDTVSYINHVIPGLHVKAVPHLDIGQALPQAIRSGKNGSYDDIIVLGAIGPHKGSGQLLKLAQQAWLSHPEMRFHVVGYTDIDEALEAIGNVTITGPYKPQELGSLIDATGGRIALFLHNWPETFSYTLSEAVGLGLYPVAPDIGAPAERIRATGFGAIFSFPISPEAVLEALTNLKAKKALDASSCTPIAFKDDRQPYEIAEALGLTADGSATRRVRVRPRVVA